jgi:hypothetical protein
MKLLKLTQIVIKMPEMPPEVMQGMSQEELMDAQTIGPDQDFWINPDAVTAVYQNEHPKIDGGAILTINSSPQMPPQVAVRQSVTEVVEMLTK